mgnify:FL=1|jgi:lysophospholipase L1-like esterase
MRARPVYRRVWFIGDSLTAGYDADSGQQSFASHATAALRSVRGGTAASVLNVNTCGGTVADGTRQAMAELSFLPDIVVLQFGENDGPYGAGFAAGYARLIGQLWREGRRPLVAAFSVWNPHTDADYSRMSADIERLAREAGGVFVSLDQASGDAGNREAGRDVSWLNDAGHTLSDSFHPNSAGHAAMAAALAAALHPFVVAGPPRRTALPRPARIRKEDRR